MTNKEIKLELAKVALDKCNFLSSESLAETLRNLYEWVTEEKTLISIDDTQDEEPKASYESDSVSKIIEYITSDSDASIGIPTKLRKAFFSNNIATIGDLLRMGQRDFKKTRDVGKWSVRWVDEALKVLYGIEFW